MRTLSACPTTYSQLCTNRPLNYGLLSIQDSQLGLSGVHYREVSLYVRIYKEFAKSKYDIMKKRHDSF